jgi:predicted DNA-binding transcriptional regulator AlpA
MEQGKIDKQLVRSPLIAKDLGITAGTLRTWRCQGKGPQYIKIGATVFYDRNVIDQWLAARVFQNTSQHDLIVDGGDSHE